MLHLLICDFAWTLAEFHEPRENQSSYMTIPYSISTHFCDVILEHAKGVASALFVSCDDVKNQIHWAFHTWASQTTLLRFVHAPYTTDRGHVHVGAELSSNEFAAVTIRRAAVPGIRVDFSKDLCWSMDSDFCRHVDVLRDHIQSYMLLMSLGTVLTTFFIVALIRLFSARPQTD